MSLCPPSHVYDYVDGFLGLEELLEFLDHVERCHRCFDRLLAIRRAQHPGNYQTNLRPRPIVIDGVKYA